MSWVMALAPSRLRRPGGGAKLKIAWRKPSYLSQIFLCWTARACKAPEAEDMMSLPLVRWFWRNNYSLLVTRQDKTETSMYGSRRVIRKENRFAQTFYPVFTSYTSIVWPLGWTLYTASTWDCNFEFMYLCISKDMFLPRWLCTGGPYYVFLYLCILCIYTLYLCINVCVESRT